MQTRAARNLFAAGALLALSGCIGAGNQELVSVPPERAQSFMVAAGDRMAVEIDAGELFIEGTDGSAGAALLTPRCRENSRRCRERVTAAGVDVNGGDGLLRIGLNPAAEAADAVLLKTDLPRNHPLDVIMKYGVVEVSGIHDSVRISLTAGDVSVRLPRELVGTVRLRARFGDASLVVDGRTVEGTRATLVGAGVDWSGDGVHEVRVDVRYGAVNVSLY